MTIVVRPGAADDLEQIFAWISKDNPAAHSKWFGASVGESVGWLSPE